MKLRLGWPGIGAAIGIVLAALVSACGGGGGIGGTGAPAGTLRVALTDAPSCGYDHVYVTVVKVRVNQSATAADGDSGWSEIVLPTPRRIDLLTLTNGVLDNLGETPLPAGTYTQLRLVLADNAGQAPWANAVVLSSDANTEIPLDTPSAQQSGLKMNVGITVPANKVVDVVLDFDACKSVVRRGNSGRYNLKPVVSVTTVLSDAGLRIVGWVAPEAAASAPSVSVQASGVPVKATLPDPVTGQFVLYPVPVGTYDLVVVTPGHATAVMTGVPVIDTAYTFASSASAPIAPALAASAPRTVTGTVDAAEVAIVRALQTLTGGPTVEVAATPVDAAASSPFAFSLPVDAPQRVGYVANPASIVLTPDAGAAGKYTIKATAAGLDKAQAVDTSASNVPPVTFTFP